MILAQVAVKNKAVTYFAVFLIVIAGIAGFFNLGQLEDPDFSIKTAIVTTLYPGASPEEVEEEVTDRLELAIQQLEQVDFLESRSSAGQSIIKVNIQPQYWANRLPQVWDELRRKVSDAEAYLPPGAEKPIVNDDFGDVFGHLIAIVGDGFSYAEIEKYAKELKKELSLVEGVARVDLWGVQEKVIYLDASETQLSALGISEASLENTLRLQNQVVDAGNVNVQNRRMRIAPTGEFQSPEDIANLIIQPSLTESIQNSSSSNLLQQTTELIRIQDIGTVRRGYREPPTNKMRFNGEPAIGLAISNMPGVNVVEMGRAVNARLQELIPQLPIGIEINRVHWQGDVVAKAVNGFLVNFLEAVAIVIVVLTIGMGWRLAFIIGTALVLTILATFTLMAAFGIDLQRMSLGALIIALGMMVDNAIVVADGFVVRLHRGMDRVKAAIEAAAQPAMPLLGATVVAVMAFYPIFASVENAGEYCRTLFTVVAISLLASWVISVTLTPLQCIDMLPDPKDDSDSGDPYSHGLFKKFRSVLESAIRFRMLTIIGMVGLLIIAIVGFGNVKQLFFPDSSMEKFIIDYWAPQGIRIEQTSADLKEIEEKLLADERVAAVSTFIGAGPPRFYLPVDSEQPNPSYGQIIANVNNFKDINDLIREYDTFLASEYPEAIIPVRKYGVGPSNTWRFELRISGPSDASPVKLRQIANQVEQIIEHAPVGGLHQTDWRQRIQKIVPQYNEERGRWTGIWRDDIARATKRAFDGRTVGLYREDDDLIPIVLRHVEQDRENIGGIDVLQVQPSNSTQTVPLSQVTDDVITKWEDPIIWRRDRHRTITVQANPVFGVTLLNLITTVKAEIDSIEIPKGYKIEWGGETEDSHDAQASLIPGVIPAITIMLFVVVALFNAFRPPIIIFLTIPFVIIGMTVGLLSTGAAFGFVALLGAMSLSGMMIKNAVVLLDQVNLNLKEGMEQYEAVIQATLSRLRPVVLAAATTVLGVIPLIQDVFWIGLAVTVMAGLTFGTILTMILVPVFYTTFFRISSPKH